jgi:hypothetical protein
MRQRFNQQNALAAIELAQMVADYCHALDRNEGAKGTIFFTEDCVVEVGAISYRGHAAMKKFYADVAQHAQSQQQEGVWTSRHGFINFRISALEETRATVNFIFVNFSGSGKPPLAGTTPTIVSDARFECRRDPQGLWLIAEFHATPIFMGDDPLVKNFVVGH